MMFTSTLVRRSLSRVARTAAHPMRAAAPISTALWSRSMSTSGGEQLAALTDAFPHMDVVRYTHKNRTWSLQHVHYYSEALAIGLVENGLQTGDVVLSWLPSHFSEQMVLQFACSKAGLLLYSLDPALATTDPTAAEASLKAALQLSKANVLVSQEAGSDVNYIRLAESVIPELKMFDYSSGAPFVTPRFPDLRLCIQTGFDQDDKYGWLPLRHMVVPADNLDTMIDTPPTSKTPLAGEFKLDAKGIPTGLGAVLTNEQVLAKNLWPTYSAILKKEFHSVEGVGVIF